MQENKLYCFPKGTRNPICSLSTFFQSEGVIGRLDSAFLKDIFEYSDVADVL